MRIEGDSIGIAGLLLVVLLAIGAERGHRCTCFTLESGGRTAPSWLWGKVVRRAKIAHNGIDVVSSRAHGQPLHSSGALYQSSPPQQQRGPPPPPRRGQTSSQRRGGRGGGGGGYGNGSSDAGPRNRSGNAGTYNSHGSDHAALKLENPLLYRKARASPAPPPPQAQQQRRVSTSPSSASPTQRNGRRAASSTSSWGRLGVNGAETSVPSDDVARGGSTIAVDKGTKNAGCC